MSVAASPGFNVETCILRLALTSLNQPDVQADSYLLSGLNFEVGSTPAV